MIYEYKCETCGTMQDISMKMNDEHPKFVPCTNCDSEAQRYFSISPIIPEHMKAGADGFNYEKSGQIHGKRFF